MALQTSDEVLRIPCAYDTGFGMPAWLHLIAVSTYGRCWVCAACQLGVLKFPHDALGCLRTLHVTCIR